MDLLMFPNKKIRAEVIKAYLQGKDYKGVVCFSCGNATRELKNVGLDVIDISPNGDFVPLHWFQPSLIKKFFPEYFDATSGHLDLEVMTNIAERYKKELQGKIKDINYVPTGSGETIVCLKLAFPDKKFVAVYNIDNATKFEKEAILNELVKLVSEKIIFLDLENQNMSSKL